MKPQLFIGSSTEHLNIAYAIQENLDHDFEPTVWTQGIFSLSKATLESLVSHLKEADYGIFVLTPDDLARVRDQTHEVARDNVVFELGLFIGRIGREHTYIVTPRDNNNLKLPTDLLGITTADYDPNRSDNNEVAALGAACNKIRRHINSNENNRSKIYYGLGKYGYFEDFVDEFGQLIEEATVMELMFIHSRRWRENHDRALRRFLAKENSKLTVFLPDVRRKDLMDEMRIHFDDGEAIPGLVRDAYRYFHQINNEHKGEVKVYLFKKYPTYSFYRFDDEIIFAMYPTTDRKKGVPTFESNTSGQFGKFVLDDIDKLKSELSAASFDNLEDMR